MGKKRIATQEGQLVDAEKRGRALARKTKKKLTTALLSIEATFNNTKAAVSDLKGNVLFWSSSGSLGFKGAKKGTPFAASKVGEVLAEKAALAGVQEIVAVVKGVGSGREPLIRSFISGGIELLSIKDQTPIPHNGPQPKKPRRV
ncbi:MAG TPA: 30S ribosomal protein S11 [Candidatus Paceibacterota bacterium]|nr:30S ribosomal protein S11 [Candidatus Paceibacterota bacterium]